MWTYSQLAFLIIPPLLLATSPPASSQVETELISANRVRGLHSLVDDVAHLGVADNLQKFQDLLLELREAPKSWERSLKGWKGDLQKAKHKGDERRQKRVVKDLQKQIRLLERRLPELEGPDQQRLAELLLRLDSSLASAHEVLAHVEYDGSWLTEQEIEWRKQEERVGGLMRGARELQIEVAVAPSTVPILVQLYGEEAIYASACGLELHGAIAPERLKRILRESLRAMALSKALLGGAIELPKFIERPRIVLTREKAGYETALEEALANSGISKEDRREQQDGAMRSFLDSRGWRVSRWRTEADYQALLLWNLSKQWMGWGVQPCLKAGHLNWVCLSYFGTSVPSIRWKEKQAPQAGTSSVRQEREDALWRSASCSLFGCRSWIKARMEAGDKFPYARSILPEFGMIVNEGLLKATLVSEYLQTTGQLGPMVAATRNKEDRVQAIEAALGKSLVEFEAEWTAWLFAGPGVGDGLVQCIEPEATGKATVDPIAQEFLNALNSRREQAFGSEVQFTESVNLFDDLSSGSKNHARYLVLNPEQQNAWPDAHEEYADKLGFSPEGAWAGLHSVIHFTPNPIEALDGWLGTFYHRLPLLEPGLFGVGWATSDIVSVADTNSLVAPYWAEAWVVWPADGAKKVPLRFQPERPNPVPGEDQTRWGYPITLQAYWGDVKGERTIELSLHMGKNETGTRVDCHTLTPSNPAFPDLAPTDAYCLIPHEYLKPKTDYTILARCPEGTEIKTFHFKTRL